MPAAKKPTTAPARKKPGPAPRPAKEPLPKMPHPRHVQRQYERESEKARDRMLARGLDLPPMCGFVCTFNRPHPRAGDTYMCPRNAGAGTKHPMNGFCDWHEIVNNRDVTKASNNSSQVAAARALVAQRQKFFGEPMDIGPHEALQLEVSRSAGIVAWLENHLQDMSEEGIPLDKVLAQYTKIGIMPSVWWQMFLDERKHLVQVSVAAIKAGVAERKVRLAEEQGRLIAGMLQAFIHDPALALTPQQVLEAPLLIRKHLLALNASQANIERDWEEVQEPVPVRHQIIETTGEERQ